ncbi:MAG: 6-phosphofructokinase [Elusimicrobia bacterium]|nr:6-phosphofructokinase [Elusimicrobiota bacterium]
MNAAVRAVVRTGIFFGFEMVGFKRAFGGLLDGDYINMDARSVSGIINQGGTILRTGRCPELKTEVGMNKAIKILKDLKIDGLVVIGGDGSLAAGTSISKHGIKVVNLPATIDNDVVGTEETIGYDTALNTAVEAIDKIRDTAQSHDRIFVVEIMGRHHGFLTLAVGMAAGAEVIIVPEVKPDIDELCDKFRYASSTGKKSLIVAYAEGCGNSFEFGKQIADKTGLDVRVSNLGYIQRGGTPTARERILASVFGAQAIQLLKEDQTNVLVGIEKGRIKLTPFEKIPKMKKEFNIEDYKLLQKLSI